MWSYRIYDPASIPKRTLEEPDRFGDEEFYFNSTLADLDPFIFTVLNNVYLNEWGNAGETPVTDDYHSHIIGDSIDRIVIGTHGSLETQIERMAWQHRIERKDDLVLWPE